MKTRLQIFLPIILLAILVSSCGTTQLMVDNKNADIYVDGQKVGKGIAEIQRMGLPQKANISAKYHGQEVGSMVIKRKFDGVTCMVAYFAGVAAIFAFRYPALVMIPTTIPSEGDRVRSIWLEPPGSGDW